MLRITRVAKLPVRVHKFRNNFSVPTIAPYLLQRKTHFGQKAQEGRYRNWFCSWKIMGCATVASFIYAPVYNYAQSQSPDQANQSEDTSREFQLISDIHQVSNQINEVKNWTKYANAFEELSNLYVEKAQSTSDWTNKRKWITYASALLNHASVIAKKYPEYSLAQHRLTEKTIGVERLFLTVATPTPDFQYTNAQSRHRHKQTLENLRTSCCTEMARIDTMPRTTWEEKVAQSDCIQTLYKRISATMKQLIAEMIQECETALGTPPCQYAVIGLGSLARGEMTPYSDLEWAILIDDQDRSHDIDGTTELRPYTETEINANKEYFRNLTTLLHLKVLNLGETIIPAMDIPGLTGENFHDVETPRGFAFDGQMAHACKTPIGKQTGGVGDYELIQTPTEMASYQLRGLEDIKQHYFYLDKYHLQTVLTHTTYIAGGHKSNVELMKNYQQLIREILSRKTPNSDTLSSYPIGKERALVLLENDLKKFDPKIEGIHEQGKPYDVKKEIYRLANTIMDALAVYYNLESESGWDRIDELHQKGHLTNLVATQALKNLVSHTTAMRLRTYLKNGKQQEFMGILPPDPTNEQIKNAFQLNDVSLLFEIYYTLIPFFEEAKKWINKRETEEAVFTVDQIYHPEDRILKGQIYMRLAKFDKAEECFEEARKNGLENKVFFLLGLIKESLEKYDEAEALYIKDLDVTIAIHGTDMHQDVATIYNNLGNLMRLQDQYKKAIEYLEKALAIRVSVYRTEQHVDVATTYNNLGLIAWAHGQYKQAHRYLEKALEIKVAGYKTEQHVDVAETYSNLGVVELSQGQTEEINGYEKADGYFKKAKDIFIAIYRTEQHICVAGIYNNLAAAAAEHGRYEIAKWYFKMAQNIYIAIHRTTQRLDVAAIHNNLGEILRLQAKETKELLQLQSQYYQEAKENYKESLKIKLTLRKGRDQYVDMAITHNNLGIVMEELGQYEDARLHYENAIRIYVAVHEKEMHNNVADVYDNMGGLFRVQNQRVQARECYKKAQNIYITVYETENHVDVAMSYLNLGRLELQENKPEDAELLFRKALTIFQDKLPNGPRRIQKIQEVIQLHQEALDRKKDVVV